MKKMLFVINPYAGMRKASKVLAEILAVFLIKERTLNRLKRQTGQ